MRFGDFRQLFSDTARALGQVDHASAPDFQDAFAAIERNLIDTLDEQSALAFIRELVLESNSRSSAGGMLGIAPTADMEIDSTISSPTSSSSSWSSVWFGGSVGGRGDVASLPAPDLSDEELSLLHADALAGSVPAGSSSPRPHSHAAGERLQAWANDDRLPDDERAHRNEAVAEILARIDPSDDALVHVRGPLVLAGSRIRDLPHGLYVHGDFNLFGCDDLTALPEGLRVSGELYLGNCTRLTQLPAHLHVGGNLGLIGCTSLTSLPNDLRVGGDLGLARCSGLLSLPAELHVSGDLNLAGCTGLTSLPDGLRVGGRLILADTVAIATLPTRLDVTGDLILIDCTGISSIPAGAHLGGLYVSGCPDFSTIPAHLSGSVPDSLWVEGSIEITSCTRLTTLPHGMQVHGDLNLTGCTHLTSLPAGLRVEGSLCLDGCSRLALLPDDLHVGADLSLRDCIRLSSLPPSVLTWPPLPDGQVHRINVEGSGISPRVVNRILRETRPAGVQFLTSAHAHQRATGRRFANLVQAVDFWLKMAGPRSQTAANVTEWEMDNDEVTAITDYLSNLTATADFENPSTRRILARRVAELLRAIDENIDLRERLVAQMVVAMTSCGDRVILSLNDMEIEQRTAALAGKGPNEHKKLARSLMALREVRRLANEKVGRLPSVDEIEIHLAYEIRVGAALANANATNSTDASSDRVELPVSTQSMLYPACAQQVTNDDIRKATAAALAVAQDETLLHAYLATWPPWQRLERAQQAGRLTHDAVTLDSAATMTREQRHALADKCPISLCQPEPHDLVFVYGGASLQVFSLDSLLHHWVEHGTNPVNRQPLELAQLRRPTSVTAPVDPDSR